MNPWLLAANSCGIGPTSTAMGFDGLMGHADKEDTEHQHPETKITVKYSRCSLFARCDEKGSNIIVF